MIPEIGTRSELKAVMFTSCLIPIKGEVYEVIKLTASDGEYLKVIGVVLNPDDAQSHVCYEVYHVVPEANAFVQEAENATMTSSDWVFMLEGGFMAYHGERVPGERHIRGANMPDWLYPEL